jgi:hypothetical protein
VHVGLHRVTSLFSSSSTTSSLFRLATTRPPKPIGARCRQRFKNSEGPLTTREPIWSAAIVSLSSTDCSLLRLTNKPKCSIPLQLLAAISNTAKLLKGQPL